MTTDSFSPFFINSNIITDSYNLKTYNGLLRAIAGNTGNSYITYSLIKTCGGSLKNLHHLQCVYNYDYSKADADIDYINNEATHVFLILQDQIRVEESYGHQLPYKNLQEFISRINKPLIIAGLGANSLEGYNPNLHTQLNQELKVFLKFLSDHCEEIGVRGYFTQEVLSKLGINNVCVIGCPSYFEQGKSKLVEKHKLQNLNQIITTGALCSDQLAANPSILQDYWEEKFINPICFNNFNYDYSEIELKRLLLHKYHIFTNLESWKNCIKKYKLVIGSRLHGAIVATNAGVPALCTNGDSRATEVCEYLKIPHNPNINSKTDLTELYNELDIDGLNNAYPILYKNYADFMHRNNIDIIDDNKKMVKKPLQNVTLYRPPFHLKTTHLLCKIYIKALYSNIKNIPNDIINFLRFCRTRKTELIGLRRYLKYKINTEDFKNKTISIVRELSGKNVLVCGNPKGFLKLNKIYRFDKAFNITSFLSTNNLKLKMRGVKSVNIDNISNENFDAILLTEENNPDLFICKIKDKLDLTDVEIKILFNEDLKDAGLNMEYLLKHKFNKRLGKLKNKLDDKKILFYGGGLFFRLLNKYYNLSKLNSIGIADMSYGTKNADKYICGYKLHSPDDIINLNPDYIVITTKKIDKIKKELKTKCCNGTKIKIIPLIDRGALQHIMEKI